MIRFVDLGTQLDLPSGVEDGDYLVRHFAFYDTVVDRFVEFDGEMVWSTIAELKRAMDVELLSFDYRQRLLTKIDERYFK